MVNDDNYIAGLPVNDVFRAYEYTACWASTTGLTPDGGEGLDDYMAEHDTRISEKGLERLLADVVAFLTEVEEAGLDLTEFDAGQVGHDFWLTRNRHGCGFWDRDDDVYGDAATRDALDAIAKSYRECHLWLDTESNTIDVE